MNDSLGHPAGDALLKAVSARLKSSVGDEGTVFRLGGDEFSILLPGFDRKRAMALDWRRSRSPPCAIRSSWPTRW